MLTMMPCRLVAFTCLQKYMSIPQPEDESSIKNDKPSSPTSSRNRQWLKYLRMINPFGPRPSPSEDSLTFANNFFIMALGWAIFIVICVADVYALVSVCLSDHSVLKDRTDSFLLQVQLGRGDA